MSASSQAGLRAAPVLITTLFSSMSRSGIKKRATTNTSTNTTRKDRNTSTIGNPNNNGILSYSFRPRDQQPWCGHPAKRPTKLWTCQRKEQRDLLRNHCHSYHYKHHSVEVCKSMFTHLLPFSTFFSYFVVHHCSFSFQFCRLGDWFHTQCCLFIPSCQQPRWSKPRYEKKITILIALVALFLTIFFSIIQIIRHWFSPHVALHPCCCLWRKLPHTCSK